MRDGEVELEALAVEEDEPVPDIVSEVEPAADAVRDVANDRLLLTDDAEKLLVEVTGMATETDVDALPLQEGDNDEVDD